MILQAYLVAYICTSKAFAICFGEFGDDRVLDSLWVPPHEA